MIASLVAMSIVVAIAVGTTGLVVVGIAGRGRERVPKLADTAARAARHLNGEGRTPRTFTRLFG